ncbi:zona pellucida domain-containing protein piopio [Rhynchophorus ferrugineus]|uniref:zona pellucida domain-containing protein piopio n=1 Tax=Rhynchophorus ferrugineus TaxID=354439 RepID=UPI003FCC4886
MKGTLRLIHSRNPFLDAKVPLQVIMAFILLLSPTRAANLPSDIARDELQDSNDVFDADVRVDCNSDEIVVNIGTRSGRFNGMVYPRGLSKSTHCLNEWIQRKSPITYTLPLRGCNTMSTELDDGGIEYFNTIVVQPHLKLVTNQGKGFHIRCRYTTRNNTAYNEALKMDPTSSPVDPVTAVATMPGCSMKIYSGEPSNHLVAENVKIGDPLSLVVSIDEQELYGIRVTDCVVKDGLGWGEQKLIDSEGCPTDSEIMGMFQYSEDSTKAEVQFKAHKFPYIASVYYQCNVKLCLRADNGCDTKPPSCSGTSSSRPRRQAIAEGTDSEGTPATIEVYSGLYVNEANDLAKASQEDDSVFSVKNPDDAICISQRSFAIGICIAGLILMFCVLAAILCLLARRRKKTISNPGSSIYSGPYTNTAYSHSS